MCIMRCKFDHSETLLEEQLSLEEMMLINKFRKTE